MQIHESAEDYLETILMLEERGKPVRSIDIVNEMNYSKPSVSIAMKKLRESGYIRMSSSGQISLQEDRGGDLGAASPAHRHPDRGGRGEKDGGRTGLPH